MIKLPDHVRAKPLASGKVAYFWELPSWAQPPERRRTPPKPDAPKTWIRHGRKCPVESSPLGTDEAEAITKAKSLNEAFEQWMTGVTSAPVKGTVRWFFAWYREQERFTKNRAKTRKDYARMMDVLCDEPMRIGTFGDKPVAKVDATVADKLYSRLKKRGSRYATYAMQVCRLSWSWGVRHKAHTGVTENPFAGMGLSTKTQKGNYAASRDEYNRYRETARALGFQSMATAAALCFEGCQRVSHVFGYPDEDGRTDRELVWDSWTPRVRFALRQSKTGNLVDLPLSHRIASGEVELLYPELEAELQRSWDAPMRHLRLIVVEERSGQPYAERRMSNVHRKICEAAGLPKQLTFTSFRHGGITEIGDAGEADVRPISGQKTLSITAIYNKANAEKARRIAAARRAHIRLIEDAAADDSGMGSGTAPECEAVDGA